MASSASVRHKWHSEHNNNSSFSFKQPCPPCLMKIVQLLQQHVYLHNCSIMKDWGPVLFSATRYQCFLTALQVTHFFQCSSFFLPAAVSLFVMEQMQMQLHLSHWVHSLIQPTPWLVMWPTRASEDGPSCGKTKRRRRVWRRRLYSLHWLTGPLLKWK